MMSMSPETLLAFTLAMFLLALSPGPGFLMVVARALTAPDVVVLSAVVILVLVLVLSVYAFLAARAGRLLKSERPPGLAEPRHRRHAGRRRHRGGDAVIPPHLPSPKRSRFGFAQAGPAPPKLALRAH